MATRKGVCPYCFSKHNIKNQIIDVNIDNKFSTCRNCGRKILSIEAAKKYDNYIEKQLKKVSYKLYVKGNAQEAYILYGNILSISEKNPEATFGRIVSLIYASKMHKSYIQEALNLFKNDSVIVFRKMSDKEKYINYILKLNTAVDDYIKIVKSTLTIKKHFYDAECLCVYLGHLNEVNDFKDTLVNEIKFLEKHYDSSKAHYVRNSIEQSIEENESILSNSFRTANGFLYKIDKINRKGEAVLLDLKSKINTHISIHRMATFDSTNKQLKHIKENVFKNNSLRIVFTNLAFIGFVIFYLGSIVCGLLASFNQSNNMIFVLYIVGCAMFAALAIFLTIVFAILCNDLKKRIKKVS